MRSRIVAGILAVLISCLPAAALADGVGDSSVRILMPLTVAPSANLQFGAFTKGGSFAVGDMIQIQSNSNTATYTPVGSFVPVHGPATHRASFLITGAPGFLIDVFLPVGVIDMAPGNKLQLLNLLPDGGHGNPHPLAGGSETYFVGGTLYVNDATVGPGTYSATFPVTVQYH